MTAPDSVPLAISQNQEFIEESGNIQDFVEEDRWRLSRKQLILVISAVIAIGVGGYLAYEYNADKLFNSYFEWVASNKILGMLVHIGLIILFGICCLPGLGLLYLGAGFLFRPLYMAFLLNCITIFVGVSTAFFIGRYFFTSWVLQMLKKVRKVEEIKVVIQESSLMTFLLRVAMPVPLGTYVFAIMTCDWKAYWMGTIIAIVVRVIPPTYLGSTLTSILSLTRPEPGQDNRTNLTIAFSSYVIQMCVLVCIGIWCEAALELVQDGRMRFQMSWKQLKERNRRYIMIAVAFSLFCLVVGPIVIWTLDRFKPIPL